MSYQIGSGINVGHHGRTSKCWLQRSASLRNPAGARRLIDVLTRKWLNVCNRFIVAVEPVRTGVPVTVHLSPTQMLRLSKDQGQLSALSPEPGRKSSEARRLNGLTWAFGRHYGGVAGHFLWHHEPASRRWEDYMARLEFSCRCVRGGLAALSLLFLASSA